MCLMTWWQNYSVWVEVVCEVRVMENGLVKRDEAVKTLHKMRCDKAARVHCLVDEFLKVGGNCVVGW